MIIDQSMWHDVGKQPMKEMVHKLYKRKLFIKKINNYKR